MLDVRFLDQPLQSGRDARVAQASERLVVQQRQMKDLGGRGKSDKITPLFAQARSFQNGIAITRKAGRISLGVLSINWARLQKHRLEIRTRGRVIVTQAAVTPKVVDHVVGFVRPREH